MDKYLERAENLHKAQKKGAEWRHAMAALVQENDQFSNPFFLRLFVCLFVLLLLFFFSLRGNLRQTLQESQERETN